MKHKISNLDCSTLQYLSTTELIKVYCKLIQAAKCRGTITYKCLAKIMGLPLSGSHMAKETGRILGDISKIEHHFQRPMLSAVVVRSDNTGVGNGFFGLAEELNKFDSSQDDKNVFYNNELNSVYNTWK